MHPNNISFAFDNGSPNTGSAKNLNAILMVKLMTLM